MTHYTKLTKGRCKRFAIIPRLLQKRRRKTSRDIRDIQDYFRPNGSPHVRERAGFSGLLIAERAERFSRVWAVDLTAGQMVAFARFESAVREIFAV
jgi:hypothetical protein